MNLWNGDETRALGGIPEALGELPPPTQWLELNLPN